MSCLFLPLSIESLKKALSILYFYDTVFQIGEISVNRAICVEFYLDASSGWVWTVEYSFEPENCANYNDLGTAFKIRFNQYNIMVNKIEIVGRLSSGSYLSIEKLLGVEVNTILLNKAKLGAYLKRSFKEATFRRGRILY